MLRHLELYPLKPLCGTPDIPFVTTSEEQDVDCPECLKLKNTVRWIDIGWFLRETPLPPQNPTPHSSPRQINKPKPPCPADK